ncbi:NfeD family protein [Alkaliphilus hydrothermalis]|uniref:Membrane-bound serine protease (ClpP class) n=1 Tax=Alkaliphilus hydrothermalis TaxID=1482730 RepID=A0ABS2NP18_9FIRM|nr:NfeD family protein [Alkaliphilus hydrothermalis]MBM7614652.1 membrane-bound serine protease (ClpP class) [Alkaliphilus hydrothermalis]
MVKNRLLIILLFCFLLVLPVSGMQDQENVHVIPVKGEINSALFQYVEKSLEEVAEDPNVKAVIFDIDTYGGLITAAVDISEAIVNAKIPTISFVNTKAESAGVLITISADHIAMAPGGTIGSAEPIPNTEKSLSFWAGKLRTVAQLKGRDSQLVVSMADSNIEIPEVIEKGRLLNLTTQEAADLEFTDVVASDYEGVLNGLNISYRDIVTVNTPARVKIAQILTSSYLMPLLLAVGFIGLVIELFAPGFGVGGTISLLAFGLYFGGSILAGYASGGIILIFLVGIILLTIEAFAPGFGVAGVGGIVAIVASIIMSSNSLAAAITSLLIAFVLTVIAFVLLLKYGPKNRFFDKIVLGTQAKTELGYTSNIEYKHYLGETGVVKTFLRPAGTIEINGELLDVVTEGAFVEAGVTVKIIKVEGRKIVVRKID